MRMARWRDHFLAWSPAEFWDGIDRPFAAEDSIFQLISNLDFAKEIQGRSQTNTRMRTVPQMASPDYVIIKHTYMSTNAPSTRRKIDAKGFTQILNSRTKIEMTDAGKSLLLSIQGNGTFLTKGHTYTVGAEARTNEFNRTIYNVKAYNAVAYQKNIQMLKDALIAESEGRTEDASDLFWEFLDAIQMSFNVIHNDGQQPRTFSQGDDVKARVAIVETKAGETTLGLNDVSYVAPTTKAVAKVDVASLMALLD
jgi:hypothetical protein